MFLEISQNSQENTSARVSFLTELQTKACNFIKKETLTKVFLFEFCEVSQKTFFADHFRRFLATESPLKIMKKTFFQLKRSFLSQDI